MSFPCNIPLVLLHMHRVPLPTFLQDQPGPCISRGSGNEDSSLEGERLRPLPILASGACVWLQPSASRPRCSLTLLQSTQLLLRGAQDLLAIKRLSASISRKIRKVLVMDPAGDWYYRWLLVIALPVLYNWCTLVAR